MSNPLASAEARQAAEKVLKIVHDVYGSDGIGVPEIFMGAIADSYADLVRELEQWRLICGLPNLPSTPSIVSTTLDAYRSEIEKLEAAESRNRELVAALKWAMNFIGRPTLIRGQNDAHVEKYARAEAAIQSATPKQGEGK